MGINLSAVFISQFLGYLLGKFVMNPLVSQIKTGKEDIRDFSPVWTAFFTYILFGQWDQVALPIASGILHFVLDLVIKRIRLEESNLMVVDLLARMAVMLGLAKIFPPVTSSWGKVFGVEYFGVLALIAGWLVIGCWCGDWIGSVLKRLGLQDDSGIKNGGKQIGFLERSMVYLLLLLNAPTGIGFLMTAKTIFRFGEINQSGGDRRQVEYILIGTLLSFFVGALLTVLVMYFSMQFFPGTVFKLI